tara:strand:+ start:499 stop:684 length:186 start_codon:yes stop_codon:yes gene_type:complete
MRRIIKTEIIGYFADDPLTPVNLDHPMNSLASQHFDEWLSEIEDLELIKKTITENIIDSNK